VPTAGRKSPAKPTSPITPTSPAPPAEDPNADVAGLGYEQARDELVAVVARLEAGAGTLEESLALWERGEALAARCQQWLDGARARLAAASPDAGRAEALSDAEAPGHAGAPGHAEAPSHAEAPRDDEDFGPRARRGGAPATHTDEDEVDE